MVKARRGQREKPDVEWNFLSFPTLFAFFGGALFATLLVAMMPGSSALGGAYSILFTGSLFGVSFCAAHAISRWFRNRSVDRRSQRAEEEERERRALAARTANAAAGEAQSPRRRRRRSR
jgi:hypothetical protein